jgi:RhoGEF domain
LALFKPFPLSKETAPLPALPTPEQETKDADPVARRAHILEELQSTERHFLARMQHLLQDYHAPLKTRAKSSDPLLNMYQVNTLFPRSLEIIVKAHETFYTALEAVAEEDVPKVLLEHVYSSSTKLIVV